MVILMICSFFLEKWICFNVGFCLITRFIVLIFDISIGDFCKCCIVSVFESWIYEIESLAYIASLRYYMYTGF